MSPWGYIFFGALISAVGGAALATAPTSDSTPQFIVALVLLWLGSILSVAGTVGLGVLSGIRRSAWIGRMEKLEQQAGSTD